MPLREFDSVKVGNHLPEKIYPLTLQDLVNYACVSGELNPSQRAAAEYGSAGLPHELPGPLLIIAGAGTGKTNTLAHRVANLVVRGADARRILLLTFTRRAAAAARL